MSGLNWIHNFFKTTAKRLSEKLLPHTVRARHFMGRVHNVSAAITSVIAFLCIGILTVYIGFDHIALDHSILRGILRVFQAIFILNIILGWLAGAKATHYRSNWLIMIVRVGVVATVLPWIVIRPHTEWMQWLVNILYSRIYLYAVMAVYAVLLASYGAMQLMGRRMNPTLLLACSFLIFIFLGALTLMMPRCTYHGITFIDSLFVSTSAVCITGLTPVDIAATFTPLGQTVLAVLFEIGGLGIITFTSFFALFFTGTQSIYNQMLMRDMVYSKSMNALVPTLIYILGFTLTVEVIGALVLYAVWPDALATDPVQRAGLCVFHSMSAFCNVGFSTVPGGMANTVLMNGNQGVYIVMSVLLFAGAIGFPVLVNFRSMIHQWWCKGLHMLFGRHYTRRVHVLDLNTRVAVTTSLIVLVLGAIAFFALESGNTMRGMSLYHRMVQSVFNALIPRSGGYATVNPANFLSVTLLLVVVQMWIGGSSQSMAGGVKVNTVGTIMLNLRSIIRSNSGIGAFKRNIAIPSVRRANAVVTLSLVTTMFFAVTIMLLEPELPAKDLFFEVISATFSVGSSLGVTDKLSILSKIVICVAMFVGRVGLLSLLMGFFAVKRDVTNCYPSENIIIN